MLIQSKDFEAALDPMLRALGLSCFGWFVMDEAPFAGHKAVLVGNHALEDTHAMWDVFSSSPEYGDGLANSLDRWTKRVIGGIAVSTGSNVIYPFGEMLWPFQRYASAATGMKSSPIGLMIHPEFGLWQAFRAVLIFNEKVELDERDDLTHPCDTCSDKPCLNSCPVDAFTSLGFAVSDCRDHLASSNGPDCKSLGCQARAACPVGVPYSDHQIKFHMKSFGRF